MAQAMQEVLLAEEEAAQLRKEAELFKVKTVETARQRAIQIAAEQEEQRDKKRNQAIEDTKEKLTKEKNAILKEAQKDIDKIEKKAEKNMLTAVNFMLKEFEKQINRK